MTDETLYRAFSKGDTAAFETLVLTHRHNLVYFVYSFVKDYHLSEDVVQEVFAKLLCRPDLYNHLLCFAEHERNVRLAWAALACNHSHASLCPSHNCCRTSWMLCCGR